MLDSDLALLYGVETKRINEAAKRNIDRFPGWFMFQLTQTEWQELKNRKGFQYSISDINDGLRSQFVTLNEEKDVLRSQIATSSLEYGGRRYLPFAFTEQGVAMLSAVLKSETAIKVSIQIISAFVALRKLHLHSAGLYQRMENIEKKQIEADGHFNKIFSALEKADTIPAQGIFFNGQIFDAYKFAADLIRKAKENIILIDNYIDDTTLQIFAKRKSGIPVTIYTQKISRQLELDAEKFIAQYGLLSLKILSSSHDRFLILDQKEMYHMGASLKDLGKKIFAFSKMDNEVWRFEDLTV